MTALRITYLIHTFADWLKHRRELNEIRQLDRGEFDRIAADLEISSMIDQRANHLQLPAVYASSLYNL